MPIDLKRKDNQASYFMLRDMGTLPSTSSFVSGIVLKLIQMYAGSTGTHRSESLGYCLRFHHDLSSLYYGDKYITSFFPLVIDDGPESYSLFIII
ncbi:hypothetical protein GLYMA_01G192700v4 [Glycine max]|uniref:Uncharacterized protein n=2 Tax=Glycine subgen. Soja TaxID=1462606 RepID=A0A0R0LKH6_SOYBN|nr:hypothetical protein JHK87_002274 [Glycine soja]KAG5069958.1 hypothetical protein JHK85_002335 [Glycine max]KAG5089667.1 hypothetical protein JHK86_002279 [Glycine max]KAH1163888.1 hypothetical protein GYH30_002089 [Glycine max]KRH77109.1 hypothetical protein GLYMA_01G192700v4 [Glycine max]